MSNRIAKVNNFVNDEAIRENMSVMTNKDIRQTEFLFDYSILDIELTEKEKLKRYEKSLVFHRKQINKATSDLGKTLTEAREVFIKSHSESFVEWYEQLGFNKDQVSVAMNRFQMTVEYPNAKEVIINLSDVAIKEVTNRKTPLYIKEKVIAGEIVTGQQIKEERKNNSRALEKFSDNIQEAEIVEDYETLMKIEFEGIIEDLSKAEKVVDYNKSNLDALVKIRKILHGME